MFFFCKWLVLDEDLIESTYTYSNAVVIKYDCVSCSSILKLVTRFFRNNNWINRKLQKSALGKLVSMFSVNYTNLTYTILIPTKLDENFQSDNYYISRIRFLDRLVK